MKFRNIFTAAVMGILMGILLVGMAYVTGAGLIFWSFLGIFIVVGFALVVQSKMYVRVREMETAVVFSRITDRFLRFLPEGQHLIKPTEYIYDTIFTAPRSVSGYCVNAQTIDNNIISVEWRMVLAVDTNSIQEEYRSKIARLLPKYKEKLVRNHGNHCLRQLINENNLQILLDSGSRPRLERQLRAQMMERVSRFGLQLYKVILTEISFQTLILQTRDEEYLGITIDRTKLRRNLERYFSVDELLTICFDLDVDHENIPNLTKMRLVRELILYCERHGRTPELLTLCHEQRPSVNW